jgi:hypothetical protein
LELVDEVINAPTGSLIFEQEVFVEAIEELVELLFRQVPVGLGAKFGKNLLPGVLTVHVLQKPGSGGRHDQGFIGELSLVPENEVPFAVLLDGVDFNRAKARFCIDGHGWFLPGRFDNKRSLKINGVDEVVLKRIQNDAENNNLSTAGIILRSGEWLVKVE